jgi:hypothetical protein
MNDRLDELREDISKRELVAFINRKAIEHKFNWQVGAPIIDEVFELINNNDPAMAIALSERFKEQLING